MSVLMYELSRSSIADRIGTVVGPAAMMTSLDMRGFSVSVYAAPDEHLKALAEPVDTAAWPGIHTLARGEVRALPDGLKPIKPLPSPHPATRRFVAQCCEILIAAEASLNALDSKAGDGDTGSTLAGAARALIAAMDDLPLADHTQLLRAIGLELSQTMGGSSGVLLAIFFAAAGDAASSGYSITDALLMGLERMQEIGGAQPGDRTMVDALLPALNALPQGLDKAATAARAGAEATARMSKAKAGRSAYINEAQLAGHNDPGAEAAAVLFEGLVRNPVSVTEDH